MFACQEKEKPWKKEKYPDRSLEGYSSSDGFNEGDEFHSVVTWAATDSVKAMRFTSILVYLNRSLQVPF